MAEARFNDVRQLAGAMIFELYDGFAELPGSTAARQALVNKALQYFDGLARDSGNDPALARELASAYLRVADVQYHPNTANLGDTSGALASLAKARVTTATRGAVSSSVARTPRPLMSGIRRMSK